MPSRAAQAGPGGFSYYDHVFLPENEKDLTWAHEGCSYRSQIIIRLNGRRRTEAFLHQLDDHGHWQPVRLDDGTVSDGKVETYGRCVEAICGSADTFFTSVFAAQGKRQLSTYRNAEIKTLLTDLLGQEEIRALGQKAAETARLLKTGLSAIRQELAALDAESERATTERRRLDGAERRVVRHLETRQSAQAALEKARARHAQLMAQRQQSQGIEARRGQLQGECAAAARAGIEAIEELKAQDQGEQQRLERLEQRIAQRVTHAKNRRQSLQVQSRHCLAILASEQAVRRSANRLPLAERVLAMRGAHLDSMRQQVQRLTRCQGLQQASEQSWSPSSARRDRPPSRSRNWRFASASRGRFPAREASCRAGASCLATPGRRRP
jgi:exonuclease SbcC